MRPTQLSNDWRVAVQRAVEELHEYGEESDYSSLPNPPPDAVKPILPGDPIHDSIKAVAALLPGRKLPVEEREIWRKLLRSPRRQKLIAFDHAIKLEKMLKAWLKSANLTATQAEILAAVDREQPRRGYEIAKRAGYKYDATRQLTPRCSATSLIVMYCESSST